MESNDHNNRGKKRYLNEENTVQDVVTHHYNSRPNTSRKERKKSPIYHLRSLNNWIKSVLFREFLHGRCACVLDICCGKGGDLSKWIKSDISYLVATDIAGVSLRQAQGRYDGIRHKKFPALFIRADCFKTKLIEYIDENLMFDFVSCQFALHYSFESEAKARRLLENVSSRLKPRGYFIGTIPNAERIVKRLRESKDNTFGNEVFNVSSDLTDFSEPFGAGARYTFTLKDAVDSVPEYLVHFSTFERLAAEYGLKLIEKKGFHDFFYDHYKERKYSYLLERMNVWNEHGKISSQEWEVASLYLVFAFQKQRTSRDDTYSSGRHRPIYKEGFIETKDKEEEEKEKEKEKEEKEEGEEKEDDDEVQFLKRDKEEEDSTISKEETLHQEERKKSKSDTLLITDTSSDIGLSNDTREVEGESDKQKES